MARDKSSKEEKALDKEIQRLYSESCHRIQISLMDIPKVFAEARKAKLEGRDMKEAIVSFVATIRKN